MVKEVARPIVAVIVVKIASTGKTDIEIACKQVAQITTACVHQGVYVEEIIVTHKGAKEVTKRVKMLVEHKEIQAILLYDSKQITESEDEYIEFIKDMIITFGLKVINYR